MHMRKARISKRRKGEQTMKRPTTDTERIALLHEGLRLALDAIRAESDEAIRRAAQYPDTFSGYIVDDHEDYSNAALDQVTWILALLQGNEPLAALDALFDRSRADFDNNSDTPGYGFIYGYADHNSPISDLMIANNED